MRAAEKFARRFLRPSRPPDGNENEAPAADAARESNLEPLFAAQDAPEDPDTLHRQAIGPARGLALWLIPAVLVWAALIALVVYFLKR